MIRRQLIQRRISITYFCNYIFILISHIYFMVFQSRPFCQLYMFFTSLSFCADRNSVMGQRLCQAQLPGSVHENRQLLGLDPRTNWWCMYVSAPALTATSRAPQCAVPDVLTPNSMFTFIYFGVTSFGYRCNYSILINGSIKLKFAINSLLPSY